MPTKKKKKYINLLPGRRVEGDTGADKHETKENIFIVTLKS